MIRVPNQEKLFLFLIIVGLPFLSAQQVPSSKSEEMEFLQKRINRDPALRGGGMGSGARPRRFGSPYDAIANMPHNVREFQYASGNWIGYRDILDRHGIEFSVTYTSNVAGNPVGGKVPGGLRYADNFALGCLIETEKLFGWPGGYLLMSTLQRDGNSLSKENIKNQFTVQQVYGGQTFHWYELSYQQDFWNNHSSLKVGRIGSGDDFAVSPLYWLYMNNGIDGNPQSLPVNSRFSTYPNAVWGSRLKIDLPSHMVARCGVYQVVPKNSVQGLNWNFYPNDGVMLLGQYSWNPEFFKQTLCSLPKVKEKSIPTGFEGHYWMGGYYSSMEYPQFNNRDKTPNTYGLYWHADQTVYRPSLLTEEGLVLWSVYTLSPQQNTSLMPFQVNGGAIYTGLIPGRTNDMSIAGVAYGNYSTDFSALSQQIGHGTRDYELVYEAGYRVSLTKFSYIQPDIQWVIHPAGSSTTPNALVLGAQIGVVF
ncbi:MAG: carbohydrate porin [Verrucomicrobia bacterium]|nr:MAG: carbohydrate porin [Verrucomicrobiota bacterium]